MPNLYLIGGPNGAGKTTVAFRLFPDILNSKEFVNADLIAKGLSAFDTESVAIAAGRMMVERIHELRSKRKDFAFEATLASRSLVQFIKECKKDAYLITLIFVWIESVELAKQRIQERVREGGHPIPDDVITRRYRRSIMNLRNTYLPLADSWRIYDNTHTRPFLVAYKNIGGDVTVMDRERMEKIMKGEVREPEQEYVANRIDRAVYEAVAEELERKRKLGLPIVIGAGDRVLVMIGDTVVREIPYEKQSKDSVQATSTSDVKS